MDGTPWDAGVTGVNTASEALHLDPRQRLLIADVVAIWSSTATATAAATTASTSASATSAAAPIAPITAAGLGVYTGLAGKDYSLLLSQRCVDIGAFTGTGNESSVACGRVAYLLGATGGVLKSASKLNLG